MPYVLSVSGVVPSRMLDNIFPILQVSGVALGASDDPPRPRGRQRAALRSPDHAPTPTKGP